MLLRGKKFVWFMTIHDGFGRQYSRGGINARILSSMIARCSNSIEFRKELAAL